jgi:hypothetical protein
MEMIPGKRAWWSDNLKFARHHLPGKHPYIVGTYPFKNHEFMLAALEEAIGPFLPNGAKLTNNPVFKVS